MKVKVKSLKECQKTFDKSPYFVSAMEKFCGKLIEVLKSGRHKDIYYGEDWIWHERWLIIPKKKTVDFSKEKQND